MSTAVLGGMNGFANKAEAAEWLQSKLIALSGPAPLEVYIKGDSFQGILFAMFSNQADRDVSVAKLRGAKYEHNGAQIWAQPDRPLEVRVPSSFMFGLKRVFADWKINVGYLWVDPEKQHMKAGGKYGKVVLTAGVVDGKLKCEWLDGWADWQELHESPELDNLIQDANATLQRAGGNGKGKGKDKGKDKPFVAPGAAVPVYDAWASAAGKGAK